MSSLYDPNGSYAGMEKRGSGEYFMGDRDKSEGKPKQLEHSFFSYNYYIAYQDIDGEEVYVYEFPLSDIEATRIQNNITDDDICGAPYPHCAACVSSVLQGGEGLLKELKIYITPSELGKDLKKLEMLNNKTKKDEK